MRRLYPYASPKPVGPWQKVFNLTLVQTDPMQHLLYINVINSPRRKKGGGQEGESLTEHLSNLLGIVIIQ
jgi:hypothetical protein